MIGDYLERIRKERPVVQCITNIVTVNDCANALLGAFLAVERSAKSAAVCCALMADCGEQAQKWTQKAGRGTGTFHLNLLDALSMF